MKSPRSLLIIICLLIAFSSYSQRLKKADRNTVANLQSHVNFFSKLDRTAGSEGERLANDYLIGQFQKTGYKPISDSSRWIQKFNIHDGKEISSPTAFLINGKELKLHSDFFPFAFSASEITESSVSPDLAEKGVPWFIDLKDLLDIQEHNQLTDTAALIAARASRAANKGATALIIYNSSPLPDLSFKKLDLIKPASIPVVYLTKSAWKKYITKESLDVKLNIQLKDINRTGNNVLGYADNKADSTVIIAASMGNEKEVAALMELARLVKNNHYKSWNFLFIVYSAERSGADGINYFNQYPVVNLQKVLWRTNLDTVEPKGLPTVQQSILAINALSRHATKTRP